MLLSENIYYAIHKEKMVWRKGSLLFQKQWSLFFVLWSSRQIISNFLLCLIIIFPEITNVFKYHVSLLPLIFSIIEKSRHDYWKIASMNSGSSWMIWSAVWIIAGISITSRIYAGMGRQSSQQKCRVWNANNRFSVLVLPGWILLCWKFNLIWNANAF